MPDDAYAPGEIVIHSVTPHAQGTVVAFTIPFVAGWGCPGVLVLEAEGGGLRLRMVRATSKTWGQAIVDHPAEYSYGLHRTRIPGTSATTVTVA